MVSRILACAALLFCVGCGGNSTAPSTLTQTELVVGTGATAAAGNRVTVGYTGWLFESGKPDNKGRQFDSSSAFTFTLGAGTVIKGWDQGLIGMRVGGLRRLTIPPSLGYGNQAVGPIPANSTLVFDVRLISVG